MSCDTNNLFRSDDELLSYQCDVNETFYHSKNHVVLFELPLSNGFKPHQSPDKWDNNHVRMPCSYESKYVELHDDNMKSYNLRWNLIQDSLLQNFKSDSVELEKAIKSYNSRYESIWSFNAFHKFVNRDLNEAQTNKFFGETIPNIITLALRLPDLILCPIPLLKKGMNKSITMTQEQAASILANAFLCTFPRRNTEKRDSEYGNYPGINFHKLFNGNTENAVEKIKCIVNYFDRVTKNMPRGNLTFTRQSIDPSNFPNWKEDEKNFQNIKYTITSKFKIEDAPQMLQVDFANKAIGGGVIGNGCVQEEIRFCINPELIVSRLFTECLDDNEAFFIIGSEQFSAYSGYAANFKFCSNFVDETPFDEYNRRKTRIVAIDALSYSNLQDQFRISNLIRELNKAYAGFFYPSSTYQVIATGLWGCGAFGGHPIKSALIQLMACRLVKKPFLFSTHGDTELESDIKNLFKFLIDNSVTVSQLFGILKLYHWTDYDKHPSFLIGFIEEQVRKSSQAKMNVSLQPLAVSHKKSTISNICSKSQPSISNFFNQGSSSTKTPKPQFQFKRLNDVPYDAEADRKKLESLKNYFKNLPKSDDEEMDNAPKDAEKKTNKSSLLDALNDFF